jgi:hypothetical protein
MLGGYSAPLMPGPLYGNGNIRKLDCPSCSTALEKGFVYVRGIGGSLFWSPRGSTPFFSRKDLKQIDLGKLSITRTGGQAILNAWRCPSCHLIVFSTT